ncbi:MAG: RNA polymerase sigma factor [Lysinibacillus sp.]
MAEKEDLLQQVMTEHTEKLFRIAYYYVRNTQTAEDIVQDVFVKFYHTTTYIEQGKLEAYLAKMTVNKSKDYLRSWAFRKVQLRHTLKPMEVRVKDSLVQEDEELLIGEAILKLPLKQREAIVYFYMEGMQMKEIAALLDIPENTVKSRLRKGKKLLGDMLKDVQWEVLLNGEA